MNPQHTRITYTDVSKVNLENLPEFLVQPEFIITPHKAKFTTKLQNTFMLDKIIIAVWIIDVYLGTEGLTPGFKI